MKFRPVINQQLMRIWPTRFDRKCQKLPHADGCQSQFGYAGMGLFLVTIARESL
jgi:hypothetical protein